LLLNTSTALIMVAERAHDLLSTEVKSVNLSLTRWRRLRRWGKIEKSQVDPQHVRVRQGCHLYAEWELENLEARAAKPLNFLENISICLVFNFSPFSIKRVARCRLPPLPPSMQTSTCVNCRLATRLRLKNRLLELQYGRRRISGLAQPQVTESWYWGTEVPTTDNLAAAAHFFKNHSPARLWTGENWKTTETWQRPKSSAAEKILVPEVIFLGRSNVGKSTLLNALVQKDLSRVSATPGMTAAMSAWALSARVPDGGALKGWDGDTTPKVALVDMPGYGFGSRPEWGDQIVSYLNKRRNLRRAFLLIDSTLGIMAADRHMLEILQKLGVPFQLVATKCDRLRAPKPGSIDVRQALERMRTVTENDRSSLMLNEIIAVGSLAHNAALSASERQHIFGLQDLRWAVLQATNLETFAMDKAAEHKIIAKSALPRPQAHIEPERISRLWEEPEAQQLNPKFPPSSSSSLPHLSLQDFMAEILGTKKGPNTAAPQAPSRPQARIFDLKKSSSRQTNAHNDSQLDHNIHELLAQSSRNKWSSPPTKASPLPRLAPASTAAPQRSTPAATPQAAPRQQQAPIGAGKGVSRGIDAFEAMFPEETKRQTQSPAARQGQKKRHKSERAAPPPAPTPAKPEQPPAIVGKGVSRGLDAFESMFGEDPSPQQQKKKKKNRS
jgi:GTP-binding protein